MAGAFVQDGVDLGEPFDVHLLTEVLAEDFGRIEPLIRGWAAAGFSELRRGKGFEDEEAAGAEGVDGELVDGASGLWRQMQEDEHDGVPCALLDVEVGERGVDGLQRDLVACGERLRFLETHGGRVHGGDLAALSRQEDAVSAFAVTEDEDAGVLWDQRVPVLEKLVRGFAVKVAILSKALVPIVLAHLRPL